MEMLDGTDDAFETADANRWPKSQKERKRRREEKRKEEKEREAEEEKVERRKAKREEAEGEERRKKEKEWVSRVGSENFLLAAVLCSSAVLLLLLAGWWFDGLTRIEKVWFDGFLFHLFFFIFWYLHEKPQNQREEKEGASKWESKLNWKCIGRCIYNVILRLSGLHS